MSAADERSSEVMRWCGAVLGRYELSADQTREHPDDCNGVYRLRTADGSYYLKTLADRAAWEAEVHGYERWAPAFQGRAPELVAVRDQEPLALIITELPGRILDERTLSPVQERVVWQAAGQALRTLHTWEVGGFFGPCRRDGSCAGEPIADAAAYITGELDDWEERGLRLGCLEASERALVRAARELLPAFQEERPTPCHRDYCSANWLVDDAGAWVGVIDFSFAYWDVRAADFARYPNWEWLARDDLHEAFFEGYGRPLTAVEAQQLLVARVDYALGAIVWGQENAYYGFAQEGREALAHLARVI